MRLKRASFTLSRGELPADLALQSAGRLASFFAWVKSNALWLTGGVLCFFLFAWLSIPTRAIAWRLGHEAKKAGYVVDIEDVSIRPWGTVILENVVWTFKPSRASSLPGSYTFEAVAIDVGLFSLLAGNLDVELEYEREDGRVWAEYRRGGTSSRVKVKVEALPLYAIPKAPQTLGVPLVGTLTLDVDLLLPEGQFSNSEGTVAIECLACRAGDGETKLFVPGSGVLKNGMTIPEIDLGTLRGKLVVTDGVAESVGAIETSSPDMTVALTGKINLSDPFLRSRFDMLFKVSLSEALQAKSEALRISYQTASPKMKLDPPELGLGLLIEGRVGKPRLKGINARSKLNKRAERRKKQLERDAKRSRSRKPKKPKPEPEKLEEMTKEKSEAVNERARTGGSASPAPAVAPIGDDEGGDAAAGSNPAGGARDEQATARSPGQEDAVAEEAATDDAEDAPTQGSGGAQREKATDAAENRGSDGGDAAP